jgi:hypothetical protein
MTEDRKFRKNMSFSSQCLGPHFPQQYLQAHFRETHSDPAMDFQTLKMLACSLLDMLFIRTWPSFPYIRRGPGSVRAWLPMATNMTIRSCTRRSGRRAAKR